MPRRTRRRRLDGWLDPHLLFRAHFTDATHVVWLDGGSDATSGLSVIAAAHAGTEFLTADGAAGTITTVRPVASAGRTLTRAATVGDLFDVLAERLAAHRADEVDAAVAAVAAAAAAGKADADADVPADRPPGPLGWYGWFGYELGAALVGVPAAEAETPDAAFLWVDRAIVFDHAGHAAELVWLDGADDDAGAEGDDAGDDQGTDDEAAAWADELTAVWNGLRGRPEPAALRSAPPEAPTSALPSSAAPAVRWRHDDATYTRLIGECQRAIHRGDAYQLCLTNRVDVDASPDPASTYLALRESSPTHHGGYLRFGEHALLSASPELFLHVSRDGVVSTKPMKGTRPRHADPVQDRRLRRELLESDKERAENLMIVDLMRNDLGRIAELGTVRVPSLLAVEEYPHVHQLVSTVRARLRHPLTAVDAVRSAFPAGSMTGAPKHSAMRILHELEGGPRGVYSGAFGYLAVDGSLDLAMVIRSIVIGPNGASIGTGGGITALSIASEEVEETRIKARALLSVLGAATVQRE